MTEQFHYKDCLTNELALKGVKSQFDLMSRAIGIAKHRIESGQGETRGELNLASEILGDIAEESFEKEQSE